MLGTVFLDSFFRGFFTPLYLASNPDGVNKLSSGREWILSGSFWGNVSESEWKNFRADFLGVGIVFLQGNILGWFVAEIRVSGWFFEGLRLCFGGEIEIFLRRFWGV